MQFVVAQAEFSGSFVAAVRASSSAPVQLLRVRHAAPLEALVGAVGGADVRERLSHADVAVVAPAAAGAPQQPITINFHTTIGMVLQAPGV
jgi:hypothetical protein